MNKYVFIVLGIFLLAATAAAQDKRPRQPRFETADGVSLKQKFQAAIPQGCMQHALEAYRCCDKLPLVLNETDFANCIAEYPVLGTVWASQAGYPILDRTGVKPSKKRVIANAAAAIRSKRNVPECTDVFTSINKCNPFFIPPLKCGVQGAPACPPPPRVQQTLKINAASLIQTSRKAPKKTAKKQAANQ
ncbi:hypothetical protein B566_EDAN009459 [Ephemera danica]|nr:hypothetical protein B566_EDAN009459 [Ephemera danica]